MTEEFSGALALPVIDQATTTPSPERGMLNLPFREWKIIVNDRSLQEQTNMALDALADVNDPPFLFQRALALVRVAYDENGMPLIQPVSEAALKGYLERCATFIKTRKQGTEEFPVAPPLDVVRDLAALPEWNTIPPISGIIECPVILADNTLITVKGYNQENRLYYAPAPGLKLPPIPERPTQDDVSAAVTVIEEIFEDFPFVDNASRTNTYAVLLTAVLRPMIPRNVPLALIDKPQAGTGASLIAEAISVIVTGRSAAMMTAPKDDADWRKTITSILLLGRNVGIVDNVDHKLFAPSLAGVLTSSLWTDRLLGYSEMVTLPHRVVWIATGNNMQLGGDLPRRCYWIRMDAKSPRPWQREKFKHPNLLEWLKTERGRILAAIITIARAWILAGKPNPDKTVPKVGGFDGWRDTVGGILHYCDIPDFLGNIDDMYAQADADTPQWERFFQKWVEIWGETGIMVSNLVEHMQKESTSPSIAHVATDKLVDLLPDVLADAWSGKKNFNRVMGKALSRMNERVFYNGLQLSKGNKEHGAVTWSVKKMVDNSEVNTDVKEEFRK